MGEIYVVRHGVADRRISDTFGEYTRMNREGESQIRAAGDALRRVIAGKSIDTVECATSDRSMANAKLLAGLLYTGARIIRNPLLDQDESMGADELVEHMARWAKDRDSGLYVATMSGRAIQACLAYAGENVSIDDVDTLVPCGSVTRLSASSDRLHVHYAGEDPGALAA